MVDMDKMNDVQTESNNPPQHPQKAPIDWMRTFKRMTLMVFVFNLLALVFMMLFMGPK